MDEISIGNAWRDGEFAKFRVNPFEVDEGLWCRMCVPMIYANWEGFVVNALKTLLSHLNTLQLKPIQIPTRLVVVGLGDNYKTLSGKQSFDQRCTFTHNFNLLLSKTIKFGTKIETKSNLTSSVLAELCLMFGFDFSRFKENTVMIDRLVHVRNCIAHGENSISPTTENINNYIQSVQSSIDILLEEIDVFLTTECYLMQA